MEDVGRGFCRSIGNPLPSGYIPVGEGANGHLYALPSKQGRVLQIDPSTGLTQEIGEIAAVGHQECHSYEAVVAAENGCLYAPPAMAARVLEINPDTGVVRHIGPDFGAAPEGGHYTSIAAATNGCLYCPPCGPGHVLKIDSTSGQVSEIGPRFEDEDQYVGIALAKNGCLYATPKTAERVLQIDPVSEEVTRIGDPVEPSLHTRDNMYLDDMLSSRRAPHKLYVAPYTASYVLEVDPVSGAVRQIGPNLFEAGLSEFTSLRECREGNLWALSSAPLSTAALIEVDPMQSTVLVHRICNLMEGPWSGGSVYYEWVSAGNGRFYATPRNDDAGAEVLEFDPLRRVARQIGEPIRHFVLPHAASNGRVFMVPTPDPGRPDPGPCALMQVDYHALPRQDTNKMSCILRTALADGDLSDVVVKTLQGKTYRAHKLLLALRSRVFRSMFASKMREANDALVELGDVTPTVSDMFMKFLYAENAEADRVTVQEVCELSLLADRYEVEDLASGCTKLLRASISVKNAARLLGFADRLQLAELKQACLDFVVANPDVADTDEWEEVPPALLREVTAACLGRRSKRRRESDWEFPAGTDWTKLTVPKLRRACAERCLAQDGNKASLIERLQE